MLEGAEPTHGCQMDCWNETKGATIGENVNCSCACVNPLDWTWMSNESVDESHHYGAMNVLGPLFLRDFDAELVSARCDPVSGMLYVTPSSRFYDRWGYFEDMAFKAKGELHAYDYTLFYRNVRVNVKERVDAWLAERSISSSSAEYEEPKICEPCGSRPQCGWQFFVQIMTAAFWGWFFCVFSCGGCCTCGLAGYRWSRGRSSSQEEARQWPGTCDMVLCFLCCCCCKKCCSRGVLKIQQRYRARTAERPKS